MKRIIQSIANKFGYRITRVRNNHADPFWVQTKLISQSTPIIFDVGAHAGSTAKLYRHHFPKATIFCFEPHPKTFRELERSTLSDPDIKRYELAFFNADGYCELSENASAATNSLLATHQNATDYWPSGLAKTRRKLSVQTMTIDNFCLENRIQSINILKLDTQGTEYKVLEGAKGMLAKKAIGLIYSELLLCEAYEGQHKLDEYLSFLAEYGYELHDFYNPAWYETKLLQVDAIFSQSPSIGSVS